MKCAVQIVSGGHLSSLLQHDDNDGGGGDDNYNSTEIKYFLPFNITRFSSLDPNKMVSVSGKIILDSVL
jgi:hypothetical protein